MLKKITLSLIIGIFITIFFIQHDPWTHHKIIQFMQKIAKESLGGNFSASSIAVNFFSPSLTLHDMEMLSQNSDNWVWRCKKCEVTGSWLQLLFKGVLDQHIVMDGFECRSCVENGRVAVEAHVMAMMAQQFSLCATQVKSVAFKNSFICFSDAQKQVELSAWFNSSSLRIGTHIKTALSMNDAHVVYSKNKYVEKAVIDASIITGFTENAFEVNAQIAGTCALSHMNNEGSCYLMGVWNGDRGRFSIRNAYNSLIIDPIIINEREVRAQGRFPLSYAARCLLNSLDDYAINGEVHGAVKLHKDQPGKVEGQVVVEDVKIGERTLCDVGKLIFERVDTDWNVRANISRNNQECAGVGDWSETECSGALSIKNSTDLFAQFFPYWRIKHNHFTLHAYVDESTVHGKYDVMATNILNAARHQVNGAFSCTQKMFTTDGHIDDDEFSAHIALAPDYALQKCLYTDKEKRELIALHGAEDNHVRGSIAFPFIRSMINNLVHYDVQGEGSLDIVAQIALPQIIADVALKDASIRLPQTYNFIDDMRAHCVYNIVNKSAIFEDVNVSLHMGKMRCLRATLNFDHKGSLIFMHAPLLLDKCLLNIKKDLFAMVSGNLLFARSDSSPACVSGNIFIDKAQLKENLFSDIIQKQLVSYTHSVFSLPDVPLWCDLILETKSPICVDTGFFQTNAHAHLRIKKENHDPIVTGSITLNSGTLNFPYKPLYINKGVITFTPEQLFDPAIEFVARNKIKKYDVSLQVEGSLLTHHIALDANPPLSEEQIVGLLLVGSEENSLNSMMPALIVQNVKNLIFSNNQLSFFDKYFKPLLGTLNINLVPSFTDQTGRGGLRGALEITVEDRWRAIIQKNFSLTEDTKFELEYLFSDDITLRAIRDERRDLGGEVEMRWKF